MSTDTTSMSPPSFADAIVHEVKTALREFLPETPQDDSNLTGLAYASSKLRELSDLLNAAANGDLDAESCRKLETAVSYVKLDPVTEITRQEVEILCVLQRVRGLAVQITRENWQESVAAIMGEVVKQLHKYSAPTHSAKQMIDLAFYLKKMVRQHLKLV